MKLRRQLQFVFLVLLVICTTGCVKETVEGETHVFTNELWVPLTALGGGLVAVPVGWLLRQVISKLAWALMIVGGISVLVIAPGLFLDRAAYNNDEFSLRTGIWGMTAVHDLKFADLAQVRYTSEERRGRRGRRSTNYYLVCRTKNGEEHKIPLGNPVAEELLIPVFERARELGIATSDET